MPRLTHVEDRCWIYSSVNADMELWRRGRRGEKVTQSSEAHSVSAVSEVLHWLLPFVPAQVLWEGEEGRKRRRRGLDWLSHKKHFHTWPLEALWAGRSVQTTRRRMWEQRPGWYSLQFVSQLSRLSDSLGKHFTNVTIIKHDTRWWLRLPLRPERATQPGAAANCCVAAPGCFEAKSLWWCEKTHLVSSSQ